MRHTLITQIVLVSLSLILIFTFLKPSLGTIKTKQDDLFLYKDTIAKVEELNKALQALIATKNAFSEKDLFTLSTFIPEKIDSLKVMRDIESIFTTLKKPLVSLTADEVVAPTKNEEFEFESATALPEASAETATIYQDFDIKFVGTYTDAKSLLSMLEKNETLVEVIELSIGAVNVSSENDVVATQKTNEDLYTIDLTVRTFALSADLPL